MESQSKHHKIETQIANLPEELLVKIISELPTTGEAIRTGILSKRWLNLWNQTSSLSFELVLGPDFVTDSELFVPDPDSVSDFVSRVDKVLGQCGACSSKLDKFSVQFIYQGCYQENLDNWLSYAVSRKVDDLDIHVLYQLEPYGPVVLPECVFVNPFLTRLSLRCCQFLMPSDIRWAALKNLSLWMETSYEDLIPSVMSGCPVLEVLELGAFWVFKRLDISSRSLKKLIMVDCIVTCSWSVNRDGILLAPHIVSLELRGRFDLRTPMFKLNVPSLVEANIDFMIPEIYDPDGDDDDNSGSYGVGGFWGSLVRCIHHVNEITFGAWCLEVASYLVLHDWQSLRLECKYLKIKGYTKDVDFPGLVMLLRSSPDLEMLHIEMDIVSAYDVGKPNADSSNHVLKVRYAQLKKSRLESYLLQWPEGTCSKLRFVEIVSCILEDRNFELVQLLLRNANQLETMIIHFESVNFGRSTSHFQGMVQDAVQKVASFPRSANHVIVQFPDFGNHELS